MILCPGINQLAFLKTKLLSPLISHGNFVVYEAHGKVSFSCSNIQRMIHINFKDNISNISQVDRFHAFSAKEIPSKN